METGEVDPRLRHQSRQPGDESSGQKPRDRYVSNAEFPAVQDIAPPVIQCAMMLARLTRLRQGDLLSLRLQNLTDEVIEVGTSKTGRPLVIQWSDELRAVVEKAKAQRGKVQSMYPLPTRSGGRYTRDGFKASWQKVMRRATSHGGSRSITSGRRLGPRRRTSGCWLTRTCAR